MAFLGIGVGMGASALGLGSLASGIVGGTVGGAGISAAVNAAMGKPITAKDILIGAGTGAITGGVGGALAAPAKVATTAATEAGSQAVGKVATEAASKAATQAVGKGATDVAGKVATEAGGKAAVEAGSKGATEAATKGVANAATKGAYGAVKPDFSGLAKLSQPEGIMGSGVSTGSAGFDKAIGQAGMSGVMKGGEQGLGAYQQNQTQKEQNKQFEANAAEQAGIQQKAHEMTTMLGEQGQGSMLAEGGPVHMQSGSFVIPADIVSALGDGSTEAGFRFLEDFFKDEA